MSGKKKHHILRNILLIIGGLFLAFILLAIFLPEQPKNTVPKQQIIYEPIDPSRTDIDTSKPYADVISIDEAHFGNAKRYTYNVVIYQRLNRETLEAMAKNVYEQAKTKTPFNALAVGFYDYPQFIGRGYRFGYVEFAPNGKWADATTIKTGDYTKMSMNNHLREPRWENAIMENEVEIINAFFDMCSKLEEAANVNNDLDLIAIDEIAINETAQKYSMTYEDVDSLLTKYNTIIGLFSEN
jgi:hypothetical protein